MNRNNSIKKEVSPIKSVAKLDPKSLNPESIVKNGEARTYLNILAKTMLEDLKEFSTQSVEFYNSTNTSLTQEVHNFLKLASEYKKKTDQIPSDQSERLRKMELLKSMKERFAINTSNLGAK
jgi:hypothetical protein